MTHVSTSPKSQNQRNMKAGAAFQPSTTFSHFGTWKTKNHPVKPVDFLNTYCLIQKKRPTTRDVQNPAFSVIHYLRDCRISEPSKNHRNFPPKQAFRNVKRVSPGWGKSWTPPPQGFQRLNVSTMATLTRGSRVPRTCWIWSTVLCSNFSMPWIVVGSSDVMELYILGCPPIP